MKKFEIEYTFIGKGWVEVLAENEKEAEEKFYKGQTSGEENENTFDYEVFQIEDLGEYKNN